MENGKMTGRESLKMTDQEADFVNRRSRFVRSWPFACSFCMILVAGLALWLWVSRPLLINPWKVMSGLEAGSIPESTLALMAAMLPVIFIACIVVLLGMLALGSLAFSRERRYISIIRRLGGSSCGIK